MLSKKLFYAVEAVLFIAYNGGDSPISGRDIAARQGLPPRYLEQLMQRLVKAGVLRGVRGPHGGYLLARERRRISVGDICQALDDKDTTGVNEYQGTPLGKAIIAPVWKKAHQHTMEHLKQVNLAALCEQALAQHIRKENEERMDFAI